MSLHGDAHPNSNSAWGHEFDFESGFVAEHTVDVTAERIDEDSYETTESGEERLYLVGIQFGEWQTDGPAPSMPQGRLAYVDRSGGRVVEVAEDAVIASGEYRLESEVAAAIAVPEGEATEIQSAEQRQRWRRVLEDAHNMSINNPQTQTDLSEFETAADVRETRPAWDPQPREDTDTAIRTLCRGCGNHVSADFVRVFSPNEADGVYACPQCSTITDLAENARGE